MLNFEREHPATSFAATLLDDDVEICDECAGTRFTPLQTINARLCGWAGERAVVFGLHEEGPTIVGRSTTEQTPDVDLRRFPGSDFVHRRHASIDRANNQWQVSHLGSNLLAVIGSEPITVQPGQAVAFHSGEILQVGSVLLQFVARSSSGPM
jgi:hypothetical protein